jgi:hypothetical protein
VGGDVDALGVCFLAPQKDSCFLGSRIQLEDDEIIIFSSFMRGSEYGYVVEYVVEGTRDPWI